MKRLAWLVMVAVAVVGVTQNASAIHLITSSDIAFRTIRNRNMATGAVNSRVLKDRSVKTVDLATGAADARVIGTGAVAAAEIASDAVGADEIASGAAGSSELADGSVQRADLSPSAISSLQTSPVASGTTIRGAVGGDFDAHANILDWGVIVSLPVPAANALSDDHVFINVSGWLTGAMGQVQPTTTDTDPGCTGTPANPTAPAGKVCIYVAGGDNAVDVFGYSVLPGTGASPYGFKLKWSNSVTGDTFIDAVWAYTAP